MDPALHSPTGDAFRSAPGAVETKCTAPCFGDGAFPRPGGGARGAIRPGRHSVGAFSAQGSRGTGSVHGGRLQARLLSAARRNPNYWKRDANGRQLPYLDSIRLDIQQNRELELLHFRRGNQDIVNRLDPEMYDRLSKEMPHAVVDAGPSLDMELVFFNQVANSPLPEYKRRWFRSTEFRRAISEAIHRDDLVRIVYRGHAPGGCRSGLGGESLLVQRRVEAARLCARGDARAARTRRVPQERQQPARSRRQQSGILDDRERRQQTARAHAGAHPAGRRQARHSVERGDAGLPFPDRSHQPQLQLRVGADGAHQRRSGSQRSDEHLAQLGRQSPVESKPEDARDALGSRDRQTDAGAVRHAGPAQAQALLRPRAADRRRAGPDDLPGESGRIIRGVAERQERHAGSASSADLLERRTPVRWERETSARDEQPAPSPHLSRLSRTSRVCSTDVEFEDRRGRDPGSGG